MIEHLYHYRAKVVSVYDGDTIRADIDLGLSVWVKREKIRLARINAPELRGEDREAGLVSRDYLRERILGKNVVLKTIRDRKGKYGRYLAEVLIEEDDGTFTNVNDEMVAKGYAKWIDY